MWMFGGDPVPFLSFIRSVQWQPNRPEIPIQWKSTMKPPWNLVETPQNFPKNWCSESPMQLTSERVDSRFSECGNHQENMGLSEKQAKPQIWGLASLSTLKQPLIFRSWWCLPPHFQVTDLLHERDILGKVGHDLLEAKGRVTIRHSHIGHNRCISVWGHFVYEPYLRFLYMEGNIYIICVYIYIASLVRHL